MAIFSAFPSSIGLCLVVDTMVVVSFNGIELWDKKRKWIGGVKFSILICDVITNRESWSLVLRQHLLFSSKSTANNIIS